MEINEDAVCDAVNNAKLNQISNIRFYCNDAPMVNMAEREPGCSHDGRPEAEAQRNLWTPLRKWGRHSWCIFHVILRHWQGI